VLRCIYDERRIVKITRKEVREEKKEHLATGDITLTLEELGFNTDIVLKGARASYSFYFPLLKELEKGEAIFFIRLPQRLKEGAELILLVEDVPIKTYPLEGGTLRVEAPFSYKPGRRFVKITLDFKLYDPEEICEAINEDLYAVILKESGFALKLREITEEKILDYLVDYKPNFRLSGDKYLISQVAYYMAMLYRAHNLYNLNFSSQAKKELILEDDGEAVLKESVLYLAPEVLREKARIHLLSSEVVVQLFPPLKEEGSTTFRALGFRTETFKGWGEKTFAIPFFIKDARKAELILRFSYGIPEGGKAWLSLLLNHELFHYEELSGSSPPSSLLVNLPTNILRPGANILTVVFSYYPEEGLCKGAIPEALFTLFDDSALILKGIGREAERVRDYLSAMEGTVALYLSEDFPEEWVREFFKSLGYFNPRIKEIKRVENLEPALQADFLIVIDRFENLSYGQFPLKFEEGAKVYDPSTGRVLWSFNGDYHFVILQVGRLGDKRVLFFGVWGEPNEKALRFLRYDYLSQMEGNAVVIDEEGLYNFSLPKRQRVQYPQESILLTYLKRYKHLLMIASLILVTLGFLALWRRNR